MQEYVIVVNKGRFESVYEAANSEKLIDWWDERNPEAVVCTECFAAIECEKHLNILKEHKTYSFISKDEIDDIITFTKLTGKNAILIGNSNTNPVIKQLEKETGMKLSADHRVKKEGYRIKSIFYKGQNYIILSGNDRVGSLYAVYAWLEKLGVRWFSPGEKGTYYPNDLNDIYEFDEISNPKFYTRGCYSEFIDDSNIEFLDWMSHNKMNYAHFRKILNPHNLKKRGIQIADGGHNILYDYFDPDAEYPYKHKIFDENKKCGDISLKPEDPYPVSEEYAGDVNGDGVLSYAEAHPEWFALIDGKRRWWRQSLDEVVYHHGDNYCTTNSYATEELCKNIIESLISGKLQYADYINLWLLDNGKWCSCKNCEEVGNYTYKLLMIVYNLRKKIVEAMKEQRLKRNVKVAFPAYHETLPAPNKPLPEDFDYENCYVIYFPIERCYVHNFNDESCTETNINLLKKYNQWTIGEERNYKGDVFIGEYYNVSSFASMPIILSSIIANDIPFYYNSGTRHFYYMHITSGKWGILTLNNYQYAKMLWDPFLDVNNLRDEYFNCYYKGLSEQMKLFYNKLENATSNMKFIKHYQEYEDVRHSLFRKLRELDDNIFPLKHVQYDFRYDDPNAGISLVETVDLIKECRKIIDEVIINTSENSIIDDFVIHHIMEDHMRFTYGEHMIMFYYYMVRTLITLKNGNQKLSKISFKLARYYGEHLRTMTEPLQNCPYGENFVNGLKASWIEEIYNKLNKK